MSSLQPLHLANQGPVHGCESGRSVEQNVAKIDTSGDIETICLTDEPTPGKPVQLIFRAWEDSHPPYTVVITSSNGRNIVERVIRTLPTATPQSAPPITFTPSIPGEFKVKISELRGSAEGHATLYVKRRA